MKNSTKISNRTKRAHELHLNNCLVNKSAVYLTKFVSLFVILILTSALTAGNFESKSGKSTTKQMLRLKAFNTAATGLADETVIYFDSNATSGFDSQYDAVKLMNTAPELPNLYTISNNKKFSINGQPMAGNTESIIALGLQISDKGVYEIDATEILNFSTDMQIYLIDMENNITQNLNEISTYTFAYKTGSAEGRFFIKFSPISFTTGITKLIENNVFNISKTETH